MTLSDLASIGEALGGLGVIITLLYVAYEVRTNTRAVKANSRSESQLSLALFNETLANNAELAALFDRLIRDGSFESFCEVDQFRLTMAIRAMIQRFEAQYFQYEAGIMDKRVWRERQRWLASFLDMPGISEWWEAERNSAILTPDFVRRLAETKNTFPMRSTGQSKAMR